MPKATAAAAGILISTYGDAIIKAGEAHRMDEVDFGGSIDLPAGINGGIAQLVDCKFDKFKTGKTVGQVFFYAAGIVVSPREHQGIQIEGMRTSIMEAIGNTPDRSRKTMDDHMGWVQNELKKLGVKDPEALRTRVIEATCASLARARPFFRFRTWKGRKQVLAQCDDGKWRLFDEDEKGGRRLSDGTGAWLTQKQAEEANPWAGRDPKIQQFWLGKCTYTPDTSPGRHVTDGTAPARNGNGATSSPTKAPAAKSIHETYREAEENDENAANEEAVGGEISDESLNSELEDTEAGGGVGVEAFDETNDLDGLLAKAKAKDAKAQTELREMAARAGYSEEEIDGTDTWEDLVGLISNPKEEGAGGKEDEPPPAPPAYVPSKEDNVYFRPTGKDGKPVRRDVECEVTRVNKKDDTCDLLNLDDRRTVYKAVPWDKIRPIS